MVILQEKNRDLEQLIEEMKREIENYLQDIEQHKKQGVKHMNEIQRLNKIISDLEREKYQS